MTDTVPDGLRPMGWWDDLTDDMSAQRAEYEADGWDTIPLHTADVTPLDGEEGERLGLSVLVPDDEFEEFAGTIEETTVERYDVYRTTVEGYLAFILAVEFADHTVALCPGYYSLDDESADRLFAQATDTGSITVYIRRLDESVVELRLSSPELLAPPEDAG